MSYTFRGGLHINDCKQFTNKKAVVAAPDYKEHMYPMRQHIGAELTPLVSVGDHVNVGMKIADSDAFVSAPVHSSVSGTVTKIATHIHPGGSMVNTVFVENDFLYTVDESVKPVDINTMSVEEMLKFVREKGLVGMGGAGFPTHIKLNPGKKIDYVLVNGAECEPYITSDHRRMLENPEELIFGLKIAMKILSLDKGYFGIEMNKTDAAAVIREKLTEADNIEIRMLKTKYPQGAEKQLIKAVTKRTVPSGKLPADVGVVVLNIDTVYSLARAFNTGMPPVSRIVTLSGDAVNEPKNIEVRLGVPYSYLFELAGGFREEPQKIISGGPMMGIAQFDLETPVVKTTSALIAMINAPEVFDKSMPCIRCGKCADYCPMKLMPLSIAKFGASENYEMAEKYHAMDCIDCGLCSYVCPANRNPVEYIRRAKMQISAMKKQQGGK